jgi:threonine/homoserine/homoserine lactone efflux protein
MGANFAAFCLVTLLVVVTPGQDTALAIRNTLAGGRRVGIASAFGVVSGQATWALATAAGLSALLLASEPVFLALRVAGAAYLVYLGARSLWSAARRGRDDPIAARAAVRRRDAYRQGLVSNLSNPKIGAFFTSVVPQFASRHAAFVDLLAFGAVLCAYTLVWLSLYACAVARAGTFLRSRQARRRLEAMTGTVLVALGVRVALER